MEASTEGFEITPDSAQTFELITPGSSIKFKERDNQHNKTGYEIESDLPEGWKVEITQNQETSILSGE